MLNMAKLVDGKLQIDGFRYVRSKSVKGRTYWDCQLVRDGLCRARAITNNDAAHIVVIKGPAESKHEHPPNWEECAAAEVIARVKRTATRHPELPPSQILRRELAGLLASVLSEVPEQDALAKTMRRAR